MVHPGAFRGSRKDFLFDQREAYADGVNGGYAADAAAIIIRKYFKRYPISLDHHVEPTKEFLEAVDDDAPDEEYPEPDPDTMLPEEYATALEEHHDLKALIKFRMAQIKRRLAYQYLKDHDLDPKDSGAENPFFILLCKLTGDSTGRPRAKTPANLWRKTAVTEINAEVERRAKLVNAKRKGGLIGLRSSVTKDLFDNLPADELEEWKRVAHEEHLAEVAEWEKRVKTGPSELPQDRQKCIESLIRFAQPILDGICSATGWKATLMAGGPEPACGGQLNMVSIHSGTTSGEVKMNFGRAESVRYAKFVGPIFGAFLKKCYSVEECKGRSLPDGAGFEGLKGTIEDGQGANLDVIGFPLPSSNPQAEFAPMDQDLPPTINTRAGAQSNEASPSNPVAQRPTLVRPTLPPVPIPTIPVSTPAPDVSPIEHVAALNCTTPPTGGGLRDQRSPSRLRDSPPPSPPFIASPQPSPPPTSRFDESNSPVQPGSNLPVASSTMGNSSSHPNVVHPASQSTPSSNSTTACDQPVGPLLPSIIPQTVSKVSNLARKRGQSHSSSLRDRGSIANIPGPDGSRPTKKARLAAPRDTASKVKPTAPAPPVGKENVPRPPAAANVTDNGRAPKINTVAEPKWFTEWLEVFRKESKDLGPKRQGWLGLGFKDLVDEWEGFERENKFEEKGRLSSTNRPEFIHTWIKNARKPTFRPAITDVKATHLKIKAWWDGLQPAWRRNSDGTVNSRRLEGDWHSLDLPAVNGLFSIVTALFFLGLLSYEQHRTRAPWTYVVDDVTDAIRQIRSTYSHSLPQDQPAHS